MNADRIPSGSAQQGALVTGMRTLESEWDESFILATRDFIEAVCEGSSSLLTAEEHRQVLWTALAAHISGRDDRVVRHDEVG